MHALWVGGPHASTAQKMRDGNDTILTLPEGMRFPLDEMPQPTRWRVQGVVVGARVFRVLATGDVDSTEAVLALIDATPADVALVEIPR